MSCPSAVRFAGFAFALAASLPAAAQTLNEPLDSKEGYLRLSANDSAVDSVPVPLSALGAVPGQSLRTRGFGDMDNGPAGGTILSLIGVCSSDANILPPSNQFRIPGETATPTATSASRSPWSAPGRTWALRWRARRASPRSRAEATSWATTP